MIYDKMRELEQLSYQDWVSNDLFSFGWFLMLAVLAVFYTVWFILLDKKRAVLLLLIGSLAAVWFAAMNMLTTGYLGLTEYKITLTPVHPEIFTASVTLGPIIIMLAEQYAKSWKGYAMRSMVGVAIIHFVIVPLYTVAGIFQFHYYWNYFYGFLLSYAGTLIIRVVYLWIGGVQKRHTG